MKLLTDHTILKIKHEFLPLDLRFVADSTEVTLNIHCLAWCLQPQAENHLVFAFLTLNCCFV